ncbi:sigma-70 family RNA polymerase sigma factor [uncultured Paludibaculum sp.]|uniref:sigma-70 family RNA polymerase sigma factor n=1 Tax=uncultured Paludibaculum sp. TaxID=1765020 RepID=UPI002AAB2278|nr:sigma-70 family RNA polymerase sigma factor [uncultured Paludibaculum sp.]
MAPETGILLEHLFRHQAGRIVAHLVRLLGPAHLDLAEEMVQEAMLRAVQTWPYQGLPENPEGWLFRVARNVALDHVRHLHMAGGKQEELVAEWDRPALLNETDPDFEEHLRDDELKMIVMCCHPALGRDASVALSLKVAGGFSVREVARAFLAEEATIAQRLVRAKRQIREKGLTLEMPRGAELAARVDGVVEVIYFLFNEGYGAHEGEALIRRELCFEALRLGRLVAGSSLGGPRVHALVAVMALQAARLPARTDEAGDLILLEEQDRSQWDQGLIALGFQAFERSMVGDELTEFHVQAAIAATHARARSGPETDWPLILELYDQLYELNSSPVVALNRAVVVARVYGAETGLAALSDLDGVAPMQRYYLYLAVKGHLLLKLGRKEEAAMWFRAALDRPCCEPERRFLRRKLGECGGTAQGATAMDE